MIANTASVTLLNIMLSVLAPLSLTVGLMVYPNALSRTISSVLPIRSGTTNCLFEDVAEYSLADAFRCGVDIVVVGVVMVGRVCVGLVGVNRRKGHLLLRLECIEGSFV